MRYVPKGKEWVTASEAAEASICPYSLYLKHSGVKYSKETKNKFAYGNDQHKRYEKRHKSAEKVFSFMWAIVFILITIACVGFILFSQTYFNLVSWL